ncbi:MAG: hypothetical protein AAF438_05440 [Pseudomonadota bacterium]
MSTVRAVFFVSVASALFVSNAQAYDHSEYDDSVSNALYVVDSALATAQAVHYKTYRHGHGYKRSYRGYRSPYRYKRYRSYRGYRGYNGYRRGYRSPRYYRY